MKQLDEISQTIRNLKKGGADISSVSPSYFSPTKGWRSKGQHPLFYGSSSVLKPVTFRVT